MFCLINSYAPNQGSDRLDLVQMVSLFVKQCGQDECVVMGGDWNCATDFTLDRIGREPHLQSAAVLSGLEAELKHPLIKQYTWVKVVAGVISAARLDRFHMSHAFSIDY